MESRIESETKFKSKENDCVIINLFVNKLEKKKEIKLIKNHQNENNPLRKHYNLIKLALLIWLGRSFQRERDACSMMMQGSD